MSVNPKHLLSIYDDDPILSLYIDEFIISVTSRLHELNLALLERDVQRIAYAFHKFIGGAATFGFPEVVKSVERLKGIFSEQVQHSFWQNQADLPEKISVAFDELVELCTLMTTSKTLNRNLPSDISSISSSTVLDSAASLIKH